MRVVRVGAITTEVSWCVYENLLVVIVCIYENGLRSVSGQPSKSHTFENSLGRLSCTFDAPA